MAPLPVVPEGTCESMGLARTRPGTSDSTALTVSHQDQGGRWNWEKGLEGGLGF